MLKEKLSQAESINLQNATVLAHIAEKEKEKTHNLLQNFTVTSSSFKSNESFRATGPMIASASKKFVDSDCGECEKEGTQAYIPHQTYSGYKSSAHRSNYRVERQQKHRYVEN